MSKIYILPDRISNRIAAGEVVERPASVVKELVENSIDAGADDIEIKIIGQGKKLIQISDNGTGMDHDDAIISLERHSTSKIKKAEDLDSISTLGFRGEALASIASVSRFTLTTRTEGDSAATIVEVTGGKLLNVSKGARQQGTTIRVEDLFFNTPARLKFLKSDSVELRWIIKYLTRYAIAHPEIRFNVFSSSQHIIQTPPIKTVFERIYHLLGSEQAGIFLPFESERQNIKVFGYCSHTGHQKANRDGLFYFINKRSVDDKIISHAVLSAYENLIPKGKYPSIFLFLEIPFDKVDVNVHPTKTEVRFDNPSYIHDIIVEAINAALIKNSPVIKINSPDTEVKTQFEDKPNHVDKLKKGSFSNYLKEGTAPTSERKNTRTTPSHMEKHDDLYTEQKLEKSGQIQPLHETNIEKIESPGTKAETASPSKTEALPDLHTREYNIVGQYNDSFILIEMDDDLYIIDQHVAHERIRYNELKAGLENEDIESQQLLIPVTLELSPEENQVMEVISVELSNAGIDVESFGPRAWRVLSVPTGVVGDTESMIREIIETTGEFTKKKNNKSLTLRIRDEVITSLSCQGAIKKNMPLTYDQIEWLVDTLFQTDEPYRCPHGRPVIIKINQKEILTKFGRK
ncbi:MAG: DNA mismatch repair endonuclease MutL [Acidobacteria bacterium]|nr:DNA mismatch repair endonuclease MutL [Acidobacteriota bacterium]